MATASLPDESRRTRFLSRVLLHGAALAAVTAAMFVFRERLDKAHVALAYLLVVLSAAADGGRRVGIAAAGLAFLAFNWFFLPPYGTLAILDPLDWFVLIVFLVTGVVASHLFHRVQREAEDARQRTHEVSALATTGAEAMRAPRAATTLQALADGMCRTLQVSGCHILVAHGTADDLRVVATSGRISEGVDTEARTAFDRDSRIAILPDGVSRFLSQDLTNPEHTLDGTRILRLVVPIETGSRIAGALALESPGGFEVTPAFRRVLGAMLYYVALAVDRLRLEQASEHVEALREAARVKDAVLASVSHDLRTPLTTISALAHQLGALGDERSEIIAQEAARLNRFVSDLLDASRLTSGAMPVKPEIVPVDELLSAALHQVEGAFGGREIRVALGAGDPLLLGRFDPVQSVRIVVNLLENANKYAPPGTPIDLEAHRAGDRLLISVSDRGPGVPVEERERIFEPLYRPDGARPDAGGAGLGLAIARGFAEAQGGTLAYTHRDGGGSTFTLTLPAIDTPA